MCLRVLRTERRATAGVDYATTTFVALGCRETSPSTPGVSLRRGDLPSSAYAMAPLNASLLDAPGNRSYGQHRHRGDLRARRAISDGPSYRLPDVYSGTPRATRLRLPRGSNEQPLVSLRIGQIVAFGVHLTQRRGRRWCRNSEALAFAGVSYRPDRLRLRVFGDRAWNGAFAWLLATVLDQADWPARHGRGWSSCEADVIAR